MDINQQAAVCEELLKSEFNQFCSDCPSKIPRWASINFGVFICIRCSGKSDYSEALDLVAIESTISIVMTNQFFRNQKWQTMVIAFIQTIKFCMSLTQLFVFRRPQTNGSAHLQSKVGEPRQVASRQDRAVLERVEWFDQLVLGEEHAQRLS